MVDDSSFAPVHEVRPVVESEIGPIVELLVRAFDDDPVPNYMFGSDRSRRIGLRKFFTIQLKRGYMPRGEVWTTPGRAGAALWGLPGTHRSAMRELMNLVPILPQFATGAHPLDAFRLLGEVDAARPKESHWYLATLGTEPALQGQGVGSALMTHALKRVDAEGLPAYLESSKERNVPFYARHGFKVTRELQAPRGGPKIWLMWREPK
ncbi:MAG TPA: GNAT family N-acetyltransferase [Acidimicrobiales bacterium]|nr:GNAT family N-acetyltransferase [Acidimicrobiales bacterium]